MNLTSAHADILLDLADEAYQDTRRANAAEPYNHEAYETAWYNVECAVQLLTGDIDITDQLKHWMLDLIDEGTRYLLIEWFRHQAFEAQNRAYDDVDCQLI